MTYSEELNSLLIQLFEKLFFAEIFLFFFVPNFFWGHFIITRVGLSEGNDGVVRR
jgi:hypothetical protein